MYDIESHLTGQTEPIWLQSMPITQKNQIYHGYSLLGESSMIELNYNRQLLTFEVDPRVSTLVIF